MLYVQLKERISAAPGDVLRVRDVADVLGDQAEAAQRTKLNVHLAKGVWRIPATALVAALLPLDKEITLMGADEVFVHVSSQQGKGMYGVRAAAAFLILFLGSALAITWFHADVGMQEAQAMFYRILTGREVQNPWLVTIPYAVGVALGVGGYYSIFSRRTTVSPLEIKLGEYRSKAEKTAGRIP